MPSRCVGWLLLGNRTLWRDRFRLQEKITGKAGAWLSGGSRDGGLKMSPLEYPNIVFFVFLSVGIVVSLIRFLEYGSISAPWDMWAGMPCAFVAFYSGNRRV